MAKKVGKDCKVTLGANSIVGMGTWKLEGIEIDEIESSEFGDNWKTYEYGMKDGGTISFSGRFDPADTTGVQALQYANNENTDITNLFLYVDNTSYYAPNQTTGYFSPTTTTAGDTPVSYVNITAWNIDSDKGDLMNISFEAKVSGVMVLI